MLPLAIPHGGHQSQRNVSMVTDGVQGREPWGKGLSLA